MLHFGQSFNQVTYVERTKLILLYTQQLSYVSVKQKADMLATLMAAELSHTAYLELCFCENGPLDTKQNKDQRFRTKNKSSNYITVKIVKIGTKNS